MVRSGNFSFNTEPECSDGDTFEDFNLSQLTPGTEICKGKENLTFKNGNLTNCTVPEGSTIIGCNESQISFCSHLHPEWIAKGLLECADECSHVDKKEELESGGKVIYTVYTYKDKLNGN